MSILKVQQSPPRFPPNKKPMFILQTVSVQWTKRSRSAPLATIRNRLPRLLPLPDTVLECEYGCHSQHYQESHSDNGSVTFLVYEPKFNIMQTLPAELDNGFGFIYQDNCLTVYFTDKRYGRKSRRRLFVLADGQTAQLRTNGRGCGFDDTYYTQHTYNLAYAKHIPREIFTQRRFDYCVSLENRLF